MTSTGKLEQHGQKTIFQIKILPAPYIQLHVKICCRWSATISTIKAACPWGDPLSITQVVMAIHKFQLENKIAGEIPTSGLDPASWHPRPFSELFFWGGL